MLKRAATRLLLVSLAPLAFDGCISVGVEHSTPAATTSASASSTPETGTFEARFYENSSDAKTGHASPRPVTWKLVSLSNSSGHLVREGMGSIWSATDLEPGKYNIVVEWGPKPGETGLAGAGRAYRHFTLAAGEKATARYIFKTHKTWLYVVLGIGILLAGAIVIDNVSHGSWQGSY
jgi:hypothetical protein